MAQQSATLNNNCPYPKNNKMHFLTISVAVIILTLFRSTESRFLDNFEIEEEVVFNLNSDSQQRSEELAAFLTSDSGDNIDLDMSQVLSSLASSSSSAPRVAPMDASGMVTELQRLVRRKIAERMIQMTTRSRTNV